MGDTMINKAQAETLSHGHILYHITLRNKDGSALRARVNGRLQTWKRDPERFKLPMKHGLKECFYIDSTTIHGHAGNPNQWCISECATVVEGP
jgi:hypothetical protein